MLTKHIDKGVEDDWEEIKVLEDGTQWKRSVAWKSRREKPDDELCKALVRGWQPAETVQRLLEEKNYDFRENQQGVGTLLTTLCNEYNGKEELICKLKDLPVKYQSYSLWEVIEVKGGPGKHVINFKRLLSETQYSAVLAMAVWRIDIRYHRSSALARLDAAHGLDGSENSTPSTEGGSQLTGEARKHRPHDNDSTFTNGYSQENFSGVMELKDKAMEVSKDESDSATLGSTQMSNQSTQSANGPAPRSQQLASLSRLISLYCSPCCNIPNVVQYRISHQS
jgi:hypothetical protein